MRNYQNIPNGTYEGTWFGEEVVFEVADVIYTAPAAYGIRRDLVPCDILADDRSIRVKVKHQENLTYPHLIVSRGLLLQQIDKVTNTASWTRHLHMALWGTFEEVQERRDRLKSIDKWMHTEAAIKDGRTFPLSFILEKKDK